jgi:predicted hydrocarbon binding protein
MAMLEGEEMLKSKPFSLKWSHLGDIQLGRPNLGSSTSVLAYRLMQFALRDALVQRVGPELASRIVYEGGMVAGKLFYESVLASPTDIGSLVSRLGAALEEQGIGILRLEESDPETLQFVLTVSEDLDCSGMPVLDEAICTYDEGFIAGVLEAFSGRSFAVEEIDCWCMGDRICRFKAHPRSQIGA